MEPAVRRRRTKVINKSLQYRFLAMILVYSLIIVFFLAIFLFVPDIIYLRDEAISFTERAAAADKILTLHARVWPPVFIIIFIIGLHSFRVFHRLVGPLYRFTKVFEEVRDGHITHPVKIREKDYLHPEEEILNQMLLILVDKLGRIQRNGLSALASLTELEQKLTEEDLLGENNIVLLRSHRQNIETVLNMSRFFNIKKIEKPETFTDSEGDAS